MPVYRRTASMLLASGLLAATTAMGAGPAGAMPASVSTSTRSAAVAMTKIRLRVDRCVHCPVTLVQAVPGPGPRGHVWRSATHRVRDGRVTFTVPTRRTVGMSIDLMPRWSKAEAHTNVVVQYGHTYIGQRIQARTARRKRFAEGCWAGTDASQVTMEVRVVRFPTVDSYGHHGYAPRAWLARTHVGLPPMERTWKGSLVNQDAFYCNPS